MIRDGHGDWWVPASLVVFAGGLLIATRVLGGLTRLELLVRRDAATQTAAMVRLGGPGRAAANGYRVEVAGIARRLIPLVIGLFAIQENVEQLVAHGRFLGFEALLGPAHPLALPILVLVALALSMVGGLVRWRIASLRRRLADKRDQIHPSVAAKLIAGRWRTIGALAPMAWMLDRLDAGRSPPILLRP